MKKIIQIQITEEDLYCLTEDGKVYVRIYKANRMGPGQTCAPDPAGTRSWKEVKELEIVPK